MIESSMTVWNRNIIHTVLVGAASGGMQVPSLRAARADNLR